MSGFLSLLAADKAFHPLLLDFSKEEISYLTLAVCQINTWNRLMKNLQFTAGNYQVQQQARYRLFSYSRSFFFGAAALLSLIFQLAVAEGL